MFETMLLGLIIFFLFLIIWYKDTKSFQNFPPGPPAWPILGTALSLAGSEPLHKKLIQMSEKYGPLIGHRLGSKPCCVVNGYEAVKSLCAREDCCYRLDSFLTRVRSFHKRLGVLFTDGSFWREQRRFTLRHLRDFGFGKRSLEGLIHEEIEEMIQSLTERADNENNERFGISIQDLFPVSVINVLWAIMAGIRHKHSDEEFQTLLHNVDEFFRHGSPTGGVAMFPWLRFVPIISYSFRRQLASIHALQEYVTNTIEEHDRTYQTDSMRDFIDVFIREIKANKDEQENTFTKQQLVVLCMDLFIAGSETTSTTLAFLFLYLMLYPDVQQRARDELITVIGVERLPRLDDAPKLHYVQAMLSEILRFATVAPWTLPHYTRHPVNLQGYDFPKDTFFLVNIYSVLMEKSYWGDPENFRPERFINAEGKFVKDDHLIAFGTGPRVCLGEPMARDTLFLFATALLQRFKFSLPKEGPPPNLDHLQGITLAPRPYKITVTSND